MAVFARKLQKIFADGFPERWMAVLRRGGRTRPQRSSGGVLESLPGLLFNCRLISGSFCGGSTFISSIAIYIFLDSAHHGRNTPPSAIIFGARTASAAEISAPDECHWSTGTRGAPDEAAEAIRRPPRVDFDPKTPAHCSLRREEAVNSHTKAFQRDRTGTARGGERCSCTAQEDGRVSAGDEAG